jgi:hypothetical protein
MMEGNMVRKLGVSLIAIASLGACSFHANVQAGTRSASTEERRTEERSSSPGEETHERGTSATSNEELALRDSSTGSEHNSEAPAAISQPSSTRHDHDHDRGHGNDADGVDEDNPGKSRSSDKAQAKTEKSKGDHDRGHGNDADGVDEDNPGKSKGKKSK